MSSVYTTMGSLNRENSTNNELMKTISSSSEQNSLAPQSLNLPPVKFELEEVQSPDSSIWETFFADQLDGGDFMVSSPVRNLPSSPSGGGSRSNYMKGKGQSPLHRMFSNSPNNYMVESLGLPAVDDLLLDDGYGLFSPMVVSSSAASSSQQLFDTGSVPAALDCLSLPRFTSEGSSTATASQLHQDNDIFQLPNIHINEQQLQLDHHASQHSFMAPLPVASDQEQDSGLQLVHLLLACAEAVAKEDYMLARRYLHQLNRVVSPLGDSMQRVASCFTEALTARLASTLTTTPSSSTSSSTTSSPKSLPPNSFEVLKIYQIVYQACPYVKFAHFTANQAIFEAFESEQRVHVIDLDILQGYQWPAFMQALAARPGGAPFLRITGVGPSIESVRETGRCLTELAHSLHVPFEFHPVGEQLEDLKPHMFNRRVGEALAVNSVNRLHRVPGNYLGSLLAMIRDQAPNIVTIVEQEASHNGPYFLGRFLEALHYYSAIFDSLDATFPADSAQRAKVEQYIFAPEIKNIVACEGADRIERHERLDKWRKIMEGKGFKGVALSANAVTQSKILLGLYSCDGYRLSEDKGCLLLGWQDRAILAASAWRC